MLQHWEHRLTWPRRFTSAADNSPVLQHWEHRLTWPRRFTSAADNSPVLQHWEHRPKTDAVPAGTTESLMHSFHRCLMHRVFSTKGRVPVLTAEIRARLWPYLGGIARDHRMKALAIGGVPDHVHLLLSLPATLSLAKAVSAPL